MQLNSLNVRFMHVSGLKRAIFALLTLAFISGCTTNDAKNNQNDQQIRQQSAQATADVKRGAAKAGQQIKEGAAVAEQKINDVAAGVKDGLNTPAAPGDAQTGAQTAAVDINSATESVLASLPGVDTSEADLIIQNRPYNRAHDLVRKGVMEESAYAKLASRVVVR